MITYKLRGLFSEKSSVPVGVQNLELRKCRFCKKGISEGAHFNHIAHAISDSLGNKHIFALDECDECNQRFSALEQHLSNFLSAMLYLYEVKGKPSKKNPSGLRKIETPDYNFATKNAFKVVTVKKNDFEEFIKNIRNRGSFKIKSPMKFDKFIPLNIYKTFCKFAINLFKEEDFIYFTKLVNWIINNEHLPFNPIILYSPCEMNNTHPKFMYFTQNGNIHMPFCIGCFLICNFIFLVEFPSDYTFEENDNVNRKH